MQAIAITRPGNTVAAHWAQKLENRKSQRNSILDTGAMSGVALADNEEYFDNTGWKSSKIFMLPNKRQHKVNKKCFFGSHSMSRQGR